MVVPPSTLLVVDDSLLDRELYRRYLQADRSIAYRLLEVETAAAALEVCQTQPIDVILLDYLLPDADGLEFLASLHHSQAQQPPVVMVTGEGNEAIAVKAMKLGVEDYLVKHHLTPELLQTTLRSAIENARLRFQLRQQEQRFRISVENMLDCFGIFSSIRDASGQIIDFQIDYLNEAACQNNRMTREMQIGQRLCEMLPAHRETGLFEDYCRVVETGQPLVKESLVYDDCFNGQQLIRAFDIHVTKLEDGFVASWRDVTDRKRLELELSHQITSLHQQQQRLRQLIDAAPIGIGIGAATGEVSVANDEMLRLHNYTRAEFEQRGLNWRDFIPPEQMSQANEAMAQLQQNGFLPPEQKELVRLDGSHIPIWISAVQWQSDPHEHLAFAIDWSHYKQTEEQLRLFVKHVPAGVAMFDREMRYLLVSDRWLKSYRLEAQDIVGRSHYDVFPDIPAHWRQVHQRCLAGAIESCEEERFVRADGSIDWVRWEVRPWHTSTTEIGGIIVFSEVITERKQAKQRLEQILQQLPLGVAVVAAPSGKVLFFNDEAERIFGHALRESETVEEYTQYGGIHADGSPFRPEDYPVARSVLSGEVIRGEEIRYRRGDGTETMVSVSSAPIFDERGQAIAVVGTFEDIAQRKHDEAERARLLAEAEAARAEAEAANRSKDDFVSLVAHELRSPLNAILGWATLLQTRQLDAATTTKALEVIVRNTRSQTQLIEDLLDVSRIVRGTLQFRFASIQFREVVEAAIESVRPAAETKALNLISQLQTPTLIQGDFNRLQQVVLNLLANAIKFTPAGGQVRVALAQQGSGIQLQVTDTGKGITANFLPFIFERFRQDSQNTLAKEGLGLGLAIAKHIVEQHGGTITADSRGEGQGATFTVQLPLLELAPGQPELSAESQLVDPVAMPPSSPSDPLFPLSGVRVLLVDDDLEMLNLTTFILEQAGALVQMASSAAIALDQLAAVQPDILLSDIAMPEQDGYDLLRQVRRVDTTEQIRAIALTAYSSQAYQQDSLQAGFAAHLVKPVEPETLIQAILAVMQGRTG